MVTQEKTEQRITVGLRRQIESLGHLIEEIGVERLAHDALAWRLRAVELGLRNLREAA